MKTLKTRLISAVAAAAVIVSVPMTAMASWDAPVLDDLSVAIANITGSCTKLLAKVMLDSNDIKIVYLEDIANDPSDLLEIYDTLNNVSTQLELITLKNTLNHVSVLNNNNIPITFTDFLNSNDVDVQDVIAVALDRTGKVMVFCK